MKAEEHSDAKSPLKCNFCGKQFKYDSERRRHEQSHTPQFECKVCKKKFSFISALRRHEKQHERNGSVVCSKCNRKFRDDTLLKRHMKYAHKGTFICSKCDAIFNSDAALHTHMKTHKPESERRFRCSVEGCNKSFNFPHHLKHHELTHTDTKQHFCKVCGKGFIQSHHLKTHLKSHDPEDCLRCTISGCVKKFTTEFARKRHLATHKTTTDSGISSDSSSTCDVDLDIKGSKSDQLAIPDTNTSHTNEETDTKNDVEDLSVASLELKTNNISINEDLSKKSTVSKESAEVDIDNCFRSCKTVLGGCIMSRNGEVNESCLCAQISPSACEDYHNTPNESYNKSKSEITNSLQTNVLGKSTHGTKTVSMYAKTALLEQNYICEGCECRDTCNSVPLKLKNKCPKVGYNAEVETFPEIEYRQDGIIKIKETFDLDIELDVKMTDEVEKTTLFPFNSCKSVLGKCIVSGNGTMGEGCFCAKMALDNSINAEEIDEITPCPNIF